MSRHRPGFPGVPGYSDRLHRKVMILVAGAIAEGIRGGVRELLADLPDSAAGDYFQAIDHAKAVQGGDTPEALSYIAWLCRRTERMLRRPDVWAAVEALAG